MSNSARNVVAVGLWGGFGRSQNVITRREPLHPSRIRNPYFINTNAVPKVMLPVATVPVSQILMERIQAAGIEQFCAITHFMHDIIRHHYLEGPGRVLGMKENDLWYERFQLGSAPGVIMRLLTRPRLRERTVIVVGGDIISDVDFKEALGYHQRSGSKCTIVLNPVAAREVARFGTARFIPTDGPFGDVRKFREKKPPRESLLSRINGQKLFLNNSSIYFFDPEVFLTPLRLYDEKGLYVGRGSIVERMFPSIDPVFLQKLRGGNIDAETGAETEEQLAGFGHPDPAFSDFGYNLLPQLAKNGLMHGYFSDAYWRDIGDNEIYWFANWHALSGRFKMRIPFPQVLPGVWMHPSAEVIDPRSLVPPVVLGARVRIDVGTKVGPFAVIDEGWVLEKNVRVSYSVLWRRYAGEPECPERPDCLVVRAGAVVEKSVIAGILPAADNLFKVVMGDSRDAAGNVQIRSIVPLMVPSGSSTEIAKQTKKILMVGASDSLTQSGWERVATAPFPREAAKRLSSERYDLVILGRHLLSRRIVRLLRKYILNTRARNFQTPVLFCGGDADLKTLPGLKIKEMERLLANGAVANGNLSDFILNKIFKID